MGEFDYQMNENEKNYSINLKPEIWYNNYRGTSFSRRAEWEQRMTERYMGEALDSLFAEGSGDIYRQNLISSLRQTPSRIPPVPANIAAAVSFTPHTLPAD